MQVAHLILTRFSVKPDPGSPPFEPAWLEDRLDLLEAYCLPGVAAQTCTDFRWILFCDESTDQAALERLERLVAAVPGAEVVLVGPRRSTLGELLDGAAAGADVLLTTRLDSDDGLALRFVERVQEYAGPFVQSAHETLLVNFQHGYKLAPDGSVYANFNPHSAFMTLCERVGPARSPASVQTGNHGYLHLHHPLHQDVSMPGWLQVVHGGNVNNRVLAADLPVALERLDGRFALGPRPGPDDARVPAPQPEGRGERAAFRTRLEEALIPPAQA